MRIGEILALTKNDIDLDNNIIHVTKTISKDKNKTLIIGKTQKTSMSCRDLPITQLFRTNIVNAINTAQKDEVEKSVKQIALKLSIDF